MSTTKGFDQGVTDLQVLDTFVSLGDVDGSGAVNTTDLLAIISAWESCAGCPEDINGDGEVGVVDLLHVIAGWDFFMNPSYHKQENQSLSGLLTISLFFWCFMPLFAVY